MLERERQTLILKRVDERSIVSVGELVELLDASEATIRRDINAMADRGEIRRIRGGAEAMQPRHETHLVGTPFVMSQGLRVAQKRAIAQAAAQLLAPGESVIINGGSTTFALAEFLVDHELDILTNSFAMAAQLFATSRNRITLPGGQIYREQNIILSPFPEDSIRHFWGRKLLTGCFGIHSFGVMEADPLIVQAQTRLLERAEDVIVLGDSSKLQQRSSMIVAPLERVSLLITDDGARPEDLKVFETAGVEVRLVKVLEDQEVPAATA